MDAVLGRHHWTQKLRHQTEIHWNTVTLARNLILIYVRCQSKSFTSHSITNLVYGAPAAACLYEPRDLEHTMQQPLEQQDQKQTDIQEANILFWVILPFFRAATFAFSFLGKSGLRKQLHIKVLASKSILKCKKYI